MEVNFTRNRVSRIAIGLPLTLVGMGLAGCGGSASSQVAVPFVGRTYSKTSLPLVGGAPSNLLLMVQKDGGITGSLVMNVTLPGDKQSSILQISYPLKGVVTQADGTFQVNFQSKPYTITGAFPTPPSVIGGRFTVEAAGKSYGPYPFGPLATNP